MLHAAFQHVRDCCLPSMGMIRLMEVNTGLSTLFVVSSISIHSQSQHQVEDYQTFDNQFTESTIRAKGALTGNDQAGGRDPDG